MATDATTRRAWLGAACVSLVLPRAAYAAARGPLSRAVLATAWDEAPARHRVGLLDAQADVVAALEVPSRAHGVAVERDGALLAAARRPGDWLLRWQPRRGRALLRWSDAARRFNGHVLRTADAVLTTETRLDDGQGLVVVRDAATLAPRAEWPTHGRDPHALLADGTSLWVANGGIGSDAATGRVKDTRAMDSSLVRLDMRSGALQGRWQLRDDKLSLRHLARAADGTIGIALQAEHDDAAARARAPLLALWRDGALRTVVQDAVAASYGGDIAAVGARFFVSAPRAGHVLAFDSDGCEDGAWALDGACALAAAAPRLWCGGTQALAAFDGDGQSPVRSATPLRLDNHASVWG